MSFKPYDLQNLHEKPILKEDQIPYAALTLMVEIRDLLRVLLGQTANAKQEPQEEKKTRK